jgi:hypothetical protein
MSRCPSCDQEHRLRDLAKADQESLACSNCGAALLLRFSWKKYIGQVVLAAALASVLAFLVIKLFFGDDSGLVPMSGAIGGVAAVTVNKYRFYRIDLRSS